MEWDARVARVRAAVAPARALEGRWRGEGQAHGEPVTCELELRFVLDGSFVEARERTGDHEDLSLYRYDADLQQLRVLHLSPGGLVAEHPVEVQGLSLVWVTPPEHPGVEWRVDGETLVCEVVWPGQRVAEVRVVYRRST